MALNNFRYKVERILSFTDVKIDGDSPCDLKIHNEDLYTRLLAEGSLGLGESYMDGWWDCNRLDETFNRILRAKLDERVKPWSEFFGIFKAKLFNFQKLSRAFQIGQHHYDIGNNFYRHMLGERLILKLQLLVNALIRRLQLRFAALQVSRYRRTGKTSSKEGSQCCLLEKFFVQQILVNHLIMR